MNYSIECKTYLLEVSTCCFVWSKTLYSWNHQQCRQRRSEVNTVVYRNQRNYSPVVLTCLYPRINHIQRQFNSRNAWRISHDMTEITKQKKFLRKGKSLFLYSTSCSSTEDEVPLRHERSVAFISRSKDGHRNSDYKQVD